MGAERARAAAPRLVHTADVRVAGAALGLDESQRRALEAALEHDVTVISGAPGTGKTTTSLALASRLLSGGDLEPSDVLVLAATRRGAGDMRRDLTALSGRTVSAPLVRTAPSVAFSILERFAAALGLPRPTLISGPEQDLVLAQLLEGHLDDHARGIGRLLLPAGIPPDVLGTRGFRDELRDIIMRASERGLDPVALDAFGRQYERPEWRLGAQLFQEYRDVTVLRQVTPDVGPQYDPAHVVGAALDALEQWEAELPGVPRPGWRHVVVDDHHESTAAVAAFLRFLVENGTRLTLLGDPDSAVQTFRGAVPGLVAAAAAPRSSQGAAGEFGAFEATLETVWRHGTELRDVARRVSHAVPSSGTVRHRRASAADAGEATGGARVALLGSPSQEHAYIARELRSARLFKNVPWGRMAVIARSGGQVDALRRALASASVPVSVLGSHVSLRDEPAVRPLLTALDAVASQGLDAERAVELLLSPLGGLDAVSLRRLRRALRGEELSGGGGRSSDALLVEALGDPGRTVTLPAAVRSGAHRVAQILAAGRASLTEPNANAQTVLWAVWDTSGLAGRWRSAALQGGESGTRADRDLDAVLALFKAAERYVERTPGGSTAQFVEHVRSQELPADSLAAHGGTQEAVSVITPASAAGREWDVVIVAGVQEGIWPDLRLRDSLLGAQALVETEAAPGAATGPVEARRNVLADEVRAFLVAVSRTRGSLLVTAVHDSETVPSVLVDLVEPPRADDAPGEGAREYRDHRMTAVPPALDLRGLVSALRHRLRDALHDTPRPGEASEQAQALAYELARLARNGLRIAHPDSWFHINEISSREPVWGPEQQVRVSPSKVETVSTCALRWALESAGGRPSEALSQSLGNLIHAIAEELPTARADELAARLDERWPELGLPDGWPATAARRRAEAMVNRLGAHFAKTPEVIAVEAGFSTTIGRAALAGNVDRIVRDASGRVRLEDLKTGSTVPAVEKSQTNPQLGAYQLALDSDAFPQVPSESESGGASLVFVACGANGPTLRDQPPLAESPDPGWAADLVRTAADTMAGARFAATINPTCMNCPVRRSCPLQPEGRHVGRSAGSQQEES